MRMCVRDTRPCWIRTNGSTAYDQPDTLYKAASTRSVPIDHSGNGLPDPASRLLPGVSLNPV